MAEHNIDKWNFDKVLSSLKEDSLVNSDYNDDEYNDPSIEDYLKEDEQRRKQEKKSASENVPIVDDIDGILLKQKAAQREYAKGISEGTISGTITEAAYVASKTGCTEQQYEDRAKIIDMGTAMLEYDYNKIGEKRLAAIASLPQEAREELLADFKSGEADPYFIDLTRINSYAGAEPESEEASMLKEEEPSYDDSYQSFDSNYADDNPEDTEDAKNNEQAIRNTEPQENNEDETEEPEEDWDDEPAADYTVDSSKLDFSETDSDFSSASSKEETEEKKETDLNNNESEEINMSEETEVNTVEEPEVQQAEQTEQTEAQTAPEVMEVKSSDSEEASEEAAEESKTVTTKSGAEESEPPVTDAQEVEEPSAETVEQAEQTAEPEPQVGEEEPIIEQAEEDEEIPQRLGIMSVDSIRPMLDELDEYRTAILETIGSAVTEQSYQNMLRDMQNIVNEAEGIFNYYLSNALYPFRSFDGNE